MALDQDNFLEGRELEDSATQNTCGFKPVHLSCNRCDITTDLVHRVNPEDIKPCINPCCRQCFRASMESWTSLLQLSPVSHSSGHSSVDHFIKCCSSSSDMASVWLQVAPDPFDFSHVLIDWIIDITCTCWTSLDLTSCFIVGICTCVVASISGFQISKSQLSIIPC